MFHVGVVAVGDVDAAPAAQAAFVAMIEKFDAVQIVQIPHGRRVLTVDLERVEGFVAARVARRFKRRQRAVAEAAEKCAGIVDTDGLDCARSNCVCVL